MTWYATVNALRQSFHSLAWRHAVTAAVDIVVVYYMIYRALLLVKGTRAAQMLVGLVLVAGAFFVARVFELSTLLWLLDNFINYSIIFVIVIFQGDIRRGLSRVGANLAIWVRPHEATHVFEEVVQAAERLARARLGALIVFERDALIDDFLAEPGELLDARVSTELLLALFVPSPQNTMHDGAVVIRHLRIHRAGAVLPLSVNPQLSKSLGTRHRAAIGITEETDAVVVVVSEERGTLSLCDGGNIAEDLDGPTMRKALINLFQRSRRSERRQKETRPAAVRVGPIGATREPAGETAALPGEANLSDPVAADPAGKP